MVVDGAKVGLVGQVRGHRHLVDGRSSVHPSFMRASVWSSIESRSSAVSVNADRMRSTPKIGRPWPETMTSAPSPAIARNATAQSLR